MANLMSFISNVVNSLYSEKGHTPKLSEPMDFMPDWAGERPKYKQQSVEEMKEMFFGIAREQNKRVAKEKALEKALSKAPARFLARQAEEEKRRKELAEKKTVKVTPIPKKAKKKVLSPDNKKVNKKVIVEEPKIIKRHGPRKLDI